MMQLETDKDLIIFSFIGYKSFEHIPLFKQIATADGRDVAGQEISLGEPED